ncbi:2OG-Fe(II) oxygenase [Cupriavidus sp. TMH.W2]|uniref:2OG-Fe(II) oxygenase n=1 Tax=Cupriavidus sp. TMH.W2 TaxID=3434465 RepID=UPI003D773246
MQSQETLGILQSISGYRLGRARFVGITHYEQGDFLGPHADRSGADGAKAIAFSYCLAAPSYSEGHDDGALIYRRDHPEPDLALRPTAGSFIIFDVPRMGVHYVAPILRKSEARISLVGFYYFAED